MTSVLLGLLVCLQYVVIAANYRAVAFKRYGAIALTDLVITGLGFYATKAIAGASSTDVVGYALGGAVGGVLGTWFTRSWNDGK